jgi:hypothetical protein
MNGYIIKAIKNDGPITRATIRHAKEFKQGSFSTFSVSKEIRIVVGERVNQGKPKKKKKYTLPPTKKTRRA